jgi:hypothetical protein
MLEIDELYKDCPTHTNTYEVDGVKHKVVSHFVGDRDINDVILSILLYTFSSKFTNLLKIYIPMERSGMGM